MLYDMINYFSQGVIEQGILTEGEGSAQLTSLRHPV
jgi:hypothetical protein